LVATLPHEKTLTGFWGARSSAASSDTGTTISFPFAVSPAPTLYYQLEAGVGYYRTPAPTPEEGVSIGILEEEEFEDHCPGDAAEPKAEPGAFCVYTAQEEHMPLSLEGLFTENIPTTHGMTLPLFKESVAGALAHINGSWAVTGP
jgi:hypothetical protein